MSNLMSIQYLSKYFHNIKDYSINLYDKYFLRTFFVAGIFLNERFRIKISYVLAYLLFTWQSISFLFLPEEVV